MDTSKMQVYEWAKLRFLTSPMLCIARYVAALTIVANEMAGVVVCSLVKENSACGAIGGGVCGFILAGTLATMVLLLLLLIPDMIISMAIQTEKSTHEFVDAHRPPTTRRPDLSRFKGVLVFGVVSGLVIFAGYTAAITLSMVYNVAEDTSTCTSVSMLIVFIVSCVVRFASILGLLTFWSWWLYRLDKYKKQHGS